MLSSHGYAENGPETQAKPIINKLYHTLNQRPKASINSRIEMISEEFLGKPYRLGALGEGLNGDYDQAPLYRIDAFDCETFVDTVIALALSYTMDDFKQCIQNIRYKNGLASFIQRNHFTDLDWNQNNQAKGLLKDITHNIVDSNQKPIAKIAKAHIDKPSWYQHFSEKNLWLPHASPAERRSRLKSLKHQGQKLKAQDTEISYLPLTRLFNKAGKADLQLFKQIPNASIIEIVRPNWDLRQQIGSALNVSHLGFAIWKNNILYFREASSIQHKVIDVVLIDYLLKARMSPTIKGINIQIVLPKNMGTHHCKG